MPKEISCTVSFEALAHFQCGNEGCGKWWSIGDAPERDCWFCPWCGERQEVVRENRVRGWFFTRGKGQPQPYNELSDIGLGEV